jgi:hypothetical protein
VRETWRRSGSSLAFSTSKPLDVTAVDTYTILALMAVGVVPGFYIGRWYAEAFRAKYDSDRIQESHYAYWHEVAALRHRVSRHSRATRQRLLGHL